MVELKSVVVHVPHSSTSIPIALRPGILLSDPDLKAELVRMTDAFTDELFLDAIAGAEAVVFPVSRLILDPERFENDGDEPMAARGMGVI